MQYLLAQANAARMRFPLQHPGMAAMTGRIDPINQIAESHPGFVWRAQAIDQTDLVPVSQYLEHTALDEIFFNLSVWESLEHLKQFTYETAHRSLLGQKQDWLVPPQHPTYVLWWVQANHRPSALEAAEKFRHLEKNGPTRLAFNFKRSFPANSGSD